MMDAYYVIAFGFAGLGFVLVAYARRQSVAFRRGWREGYMQGWLAGKRDQGNEPR